MLSSFQAKAKIYDIPSIHKAATLGELGTWTAKGLPTPDDSTSACVKREKWPGTLGKHDVHGTRQLLQLYNSSPEVLEPQALAR